MEGFFRLPCLSVDEITDMIDKEVKLLRFELREEMRLTEEKLDKLLFMSKTLQSPLLKANWQRKNDQKDPLFTSSSNTEQGFEIKVPDSSKNAAPTTEVFIKEESSNADMDCSQTHEPDDFEADVDDLREENNKLTEKKNEVTGKKVGDGKRFVQVVIPGMLSLLSKKHQGTTVEIEITDDKSNSLPEQAASSEKQGTKPKRQKTTFSCQECGRSFGRRRNFVFHMRTHTGERPCVCPHCNKAFRREDSLKHHIGMHNNERRHVCDLCGKRFRSKVSLKQHHTIHTGEKPFTCKLCEKSFRHSRTLMKHQSVHAEKKTLQCVYCGGLFARKESLHRHYATHKDLVRLKK